MTKIKEFFKNILSVIANFFVMIGKKIGALFAKLGQTSFMQKVKYGILYLPRKLDARLRNDQRKAVWGIIFVIAGDFCTTGFLSIPPNKLIAFSLGCW